jgi:hypothetical protein
MLSLHWNGPERFHPLHVDAVLTTWTTVARDPQFRPPTTWTAQHDAHFAAIQQ